MTALTAAPPALTVSRAMVHATIDYVVGKGYSVTDGAVGIRGQLAGDDKLTFEHQGVPVRVVGCESALAVREALLDLAGGGWRVIVTDREPADLGAGLLAHLVGQQLRSPDPWQAVRQRFGAVGIEAQLTAGPHQREIANGLLEAMPVAGWPAAPAGVLTRDHAYGSVARALIELPEGSLDLIGVLGWTIRRTLPYRVRDLRAQAGDPLADAVLGWIAGATGGAKPLVSRILSGGRPTDLVPLALTVDVLNLLPPGQQAAGHEALARLTHHWGRDLDAVIRTVGPVARTVTAGLLTDTSRRLDAQAAVDRAETLVREGGAEDLTVGSDLLPSGLTRRYHRLADALHRSGDGSIDAVESAWTAVEGHALSGTGEPRTAPFHAAVRLVRWLAVEQTDPAPATLAALSRRQIEVDGWVDAAVNDAADGVDSPDLGAALAEVLTEVQHTRDRHDAEFAAALARGTRDEDGAGVGYLDHDGARTYLLERILPDVVLPLARDIAQPPVLLLVLDGLSAAVGNEVLEHLTGGTQPRWAEQLLPGSHRRAGGLALLPSVTEVSRASLLTGTLTRGEQTVEQAGYAKLTTAYGLGGAVLFHKRPLDSTRLGYSISDDVRSAIDDPEIRLVTCVLNTIDDALDRSDPAGTTWTTDAIKHLEPLLERARESGRQVVITSDHGHVVERRQGEQRTYGGPGPARHRPESGPVGADEVLVVGPRVLTHGGRSVLAVSERLRYGPLKAGYHGGAAPAEVVVPLVLLVSAEQAAADEVSLAPPQQPTWWTLAAPVEPAPAESAADETLPTLFDEPAVLGHDPASLGQRVTSTSTYAEARALAGRLRITDEQVTALLDRLAGAPHQRLTLAQTAVLLGVAPASISGAVEQVRKVLNLEGYPVLGRDPATDSLVLDVDLLVEQFAVPR